MTWDWTQVSGTTGKLVGNFTWYIYSHLIHVDIFYSLSFVRESDKISPFHLWKAYNKKNWSILTASQSM